MFSRSQIFSFAICPLFCGCSLFVDIPGVVDNSASSAGKGGGSTAAAGGAPSYGGSTGKGGTNGTAGTSSSGGTTSGGGASSGTGGAGGSPTATTTGVLANAFVNTPCIASYAGSDPAIYARDTAKNIYTRTASAGPWAKVTGLTAASMDARSGLSCSGGSNTVYLAIMGANPSGTPLLASGLGSVFNDFADAGTGTTSAFTPAVTNMDVPGSLSIAFGGMFAMGLAMWPYPGATVKNFSTTTSSTVLSAPAVTFNATGNSQVIYWAWFDENGLVCASGSGGTGAWGVNGYGTKVPVPSGTVYDAGHAPAICTVRSTSAGGKPTLVTVAGKQLYWQTLNGTAPTTWAKLSDVEVASSPACVVRDNGTLDVVALKADGSLLYVTGTAGSFTTTNLGGY